MMKFSLGNPYMLLLFIPFAIVLFFAWRKRPGAIVMPSLAPFRRAAGKKIFDRKKFFVFLLYALGGAAIIFALAEPRTGRTNVRTTSEGIDIVIALDLSGSMKAIDAPENMSIRTAAGKINSGELQNRITTAKKEIIKFIEARPGDRIGLIVFAERPYAVCPPTLDHGFLIGNVERLDAGIIGDNTGIAGPVASAVRRLRNSKAKSRIVVLFTDGANNVQAAVTPRDAAKLADTFKIRVYTIGIGSENSLFIAEDPFGNGRLMPYPGEFDEQLLKDMASSSGGRYYHAASAEGMSEAMEEIDKLEKTGVEQFITVNYREWYPAVSWAALIFITLGFALSRSVFVKIP